MNRLIALSIVALLASHSIVHAEEKPAAPETRPAIEVGQARVRTLPAIAFFHKSVEATLKTLPDRIHENTSAVVKAAGESKAQIVGPMVLVYHGVTADSDTKFTFEIGFPIADADVKPVGDCKVTKLPAFKCLSVLYTGDIGHISAAYEKLAPAFGNERMLPTEESRQMMLYWENQESPNNVIQVMIGVK